MPRRNRRRGKRQYVSPQMKPKGSKRPRGWHHGRQQDERFADAEQRFLDAEEGEAA